jgi:hypothetical protein
MSGTRPNPFQAIQQPNAMTQAISVFNSYELASLYFLPDSTVMDDAKLEAANVKYRGKNLKMFYHLLTTSGDLRYARENLSAGAPHPHYLMGSGLTVGETFVNPQDEIVKFNNKSIHLRPDENTLQYVVMALGLITRKHSGIIIADEIEIEFISANNTSRVVCYSREAFYQLADELMAQYSKNMDYRKANGEFIFDYNEAQQNILAMQNSMFTPIEIPRSIRQESKGGHQPAPIYSAYELENLYQLPKSNVCDDDDLELHDAKYQAQKLKMLRFLLTTSGEMRFAREGRPVAKYIPPHYMMGDCLTAGNMLVNPQNEIVKINNKSGDFRPNGNTLQYAIMSLRLITLKHSGIKIADTIDIEFMPNTRTSYTRTAFCQLADGLIAQYRANKHFFNVNAEFLFQFSDAKMNASKELPTNQTVTSTLGGFSLTPTKASHLNVVAPHLNAAAAAASSFSSLTPDSPESASSSQINSFSFYSARLAKTNTIPLARLHAAASDQTQPMAIDSPSSASVASVQTSAIPFDLGVPPSPFRLHRQSSRVNRTLFGSMSAPAAPAVGEISGLSQIAILAEPKESPAKKARLTGSKTG